MNDLKWITSDGGPLICMEKRFREQWGGIDRLTVDVQGRVENDYDRACQCRLLLQPIQLEKGSALVLGDEPFSTSFLQAAGDDFYLVRIQYTEPSTNIRNIISHIDNSKSFIPEKPVIFSFDTPELILFDSAENGKDDFVSMYYLISTGFYSILTKLYRPDDLHSFYVHEFSKV